MTCKYASLDDESIQSEQPKLHPSLAQPMKDLQTLSHSRWLKVGAGDLS